MKHPEMGGVGAKPVQAGLSRTEKLESVSAMFAKRGEEVFRMPLLVEYTPAWLLKYRSTNGTVLEPIARHLADALQVPTEPTFAGMMESLELDRKQLHELACYCHQATITGEKMSKAIDYLMNYNYI